MLNDDSKFKLSYFNGYCFVKTNVPVQESPLGPPGPVKVKVFNTMVKVNTSEPLGSAKVIVLPLTV